MSRKREQDEEALPHGNPFADTTDRFPEDFHLRKAGFRIVARARGTEALWERISDRKVFKRSVALGLIGVAIVEG